MAAECKHWQARPWSQDEIDMLCTRYRTVRNETLAAELQRSVTSITQKAYELGLTKNGKPRRPPLPSTSRFGGPVAPEWVTGITTHILQDD